MKVDNQDQISNLLMGPKTINKNQIFNKETRFVHKIIEMVLQIRDP